MNILCRLGLHDWKLVIRISPAYMHCAAKYGLDFVEKRAPYPLGSTARPATNVAAAASGCGCDGPPPSFRKSRSRNGVSAAMTDVIAPLAPSPGLGWQEMPPIPAWITLGFTGKAWRHPGAGIGVISAVEVAKDADGIDRGPEYHLSISRYGERCSSADARKVLADFGMDGAEEDNHVPGGKVRNLWRPVADRLVGLECACKADEPAIVEDKGDYIWRGVPHA